MRALFLALLFLAVAAPLAAQTCRRGPAPEIKGLFPEAVAELTREFYDARDGSVTNFYRSRPAEPGAPWVVVMIERHRDPFLGSSAESMKQHYARSGADTRDVDGWPLVFEATRTGHEFVTLKAENRIKVVVKDPIAPDRSWRLASRFFAAILPAILIPCQT